MLHHNWYVRFDNAGVVGIARNGFGFCEIVEAQVFRASSGNSYLIRSYGVFIAEVDSDFYMGILV